MMRHLLIALLTLTLPLAAASEMTKPSAFQNQNSLQDQKMVVSFSDPQACKGNCGPQTPPSLPCLHKK
jgi:hypothetical protein